MAALELTARLVYAIWVILRKRVKFTYQYVSQWFEYVVQFFFSPNVYGEERANFSQPLKRCAPTPTTHSIDLVAELSIVLIVTPHVSKEFPPQKAV